MKVISAKERREFEAKQEEEEKQSRLRFVEDFREVLELVRAANNAMHYRVHPGQSVSHLAASVTFYKSRWWLSRSVAKVYISYLRNGEKRLSMEYGKVPTPLLKLLREEH